MSRALRYAISTAAILAVTMVASSPSKAAFFAAICNDIACSGGNDFIVQDNSAGDTLSKLGAINFTITAFNYSLLVNTSQSKPVIGSPVAPQLDVSFTATTAGPPGGSVFLYASDTDFTTGGNFLLALGGTNSGTDGTVTGRAWGGTNNTALSFSGANLLGTIGPLTGLAYSGTNSGSFIPTVSPFSLTIGVAITRETAGTSTGDLNLQAVPEPSTWAMMILGFAGLGFMTYRRRKVALA
jgi:hypothetical protein